MMVTMIVSKLGTWMHEIGAAWTMTTLTDSALLVTLVQSAASLPFFFLALPAGVINDIADRRHLLLATLVWTIMSSSLMAWATYTGNITSTVLLVLCFTLGIGNSMLRPTWNACIPEWVSRRQC